MTSWTLASFPTKISAPHLPSPSFPISVKCYLLNAHSTSLVISKTLSFLHMLCGIYQWVLQPPPSKYISSPTTSHHCLCWTLVEVTIISTWIIARTSYWPLCLPPQPSVVYARHWQTIFCKEPDNRYFRIYQSMPQLVTLKKQKLNGSMKTYKTF